MQLIGRLRDHGAQIREAAFNVTAGLTDPDSRKQRIREAITANGLEQVIASTRNGPKTYAECFRLTYGEAL